MLKESLHIYTLDEQGNKTPFPSAETPAILSEWTYSSERMASTPTITGTFMHKLCLDDLWSRKEFVEFNGERYYVNQVPTSGKDNDDIRYKHEITFVGERVVLENVFFFDVVTSETESQYKDRYRSNGTTFSFYGTLNELVSRLNDSLIYSGLYDPTTGEGYHIVIDDGISVSDEKEISLENVYFATAMQEIYNQFEIPYYWKGKTCHVGYTDNSIATPFEYGQGKGLLSITKTNADYRIINRITGIGSSDNIPHYYPNENEHGTVIFEPININNSRVENVDLPTIIGYNSNTYGSTYTLANSPGYNYSININDGSYKEGIVNSMSIGKTVTHLNYYTYDFTIFVLLHVKLSRGVKITKSNLTAGILPVNSGEISITDSEYTMVVGEYSPNIQPDSFVSVPESYDIILDGDYLVGIRMDCSLQKITEGPFTGLVIPQNIVKITCSGYIHIDYDVDENYFFQYDTDKTIGYSESGISLIGVSSLPLLQYKNTLQSENYAGHTRYSVVKELDEENSSEAPAQIKITGREWITPTSNLMPPIYRLSGGAERFYNAENDTYDNPDGNGKYTFNNPYTSVNPMEGYEEFEDIKPSIKGMKNASDQLLGEIADIAFDSDDSDEVDDEGNYTHSYFYVKLHKFNGDYGFNLFKQALAQGEMTFNMTSGNCAGCAFEVGVSEARQVGDHYEFDNPVQVDSNGDIVAGSYSDKVNPNNIQARQQDTSQYEVWVALKKEEETFGIVMPNATNNYKPQVGDTFVITNILMPQAYITNAENELKDALIKYMSENNDEKFTFSITFSRIYLQRNPEIESMLDENARLIVRYNGHDYTLYVSSYSVKVTDEDILDEITVEVTDEFSVGQSALRDKVAEITQSMSGNGSSADVLALVQKYFLSKVQNDIAQGTITFNKASRFLDRAIFGKDGFASGLTGFGAKIDGTGHGEFESMFIRRFFEVPLLVYNRVDIKLGDKWRAPGAGIVESVNTENKIVTLKLEDGEIGAVAIGDICMGIYHSYNQEDNAEDDYDDSKGNRMFAGFCTVYFTITEIMGNRNERFKYQLRPVSSSWAYSFEPFEMMTFVAYGSFTDSGRQTSVYETRTYTRMLWKQNTWEISAANIALQYGELDNLNIHGLNMEGYSMYLNNVYFTGTIQQVKPDGTPVKSVSFEGQWAEGSYDYYDSVTHNGSTWLCVNEDGTDTEPGTSNDWLCTAAKGDKGDPGEAGPQGVPGEPGKDGKTLYTWIRYADDEEGNGISNSPVGKSYIGFAYNKETATESDTASDYIWSDIKGEAGVPGAPGADGKTTYTWIAYSDNADGSGMYQQPTDDTKYIGIAVNKDTATEGTDPSEYTWSLFKGADGQSITNMGGWYTGLTVPYLGVVRMGRGTYMCNVKAGTSNPPLWVWTDANGNRFTYNGGGYVLTGEVNEDYQAVAEDGSDGTDGMDGVPGADGKDGITYYTWLRYADDASGTGISNDPSGKTYIGFAYNKQSQLESNDPADYTWSLIKGTDGVPGEKGADGTQYYTWIAYSDSADGSNMYQIPNDGTKYIGIAVNKLTQTEGTNPSEYTWSKFQGDKGDKGDKGDGYTQMGKWQTGMIVPKMGVVSMAGGSYVAKSATTNPPCFCWTDASGNRFTYNDGGYILTGDVNTAEYDTWAEKGDPGKDGADGKDGKDGADGKDGEKGEQGIQGCIIRKSEWTSGVEYRNDEALTSGTRYLDVALVKDSTTATGWVAYKCKSTHTADSGNAPGTSGGGTYWEVFGLNTTAVFTSLIIAKDASIDFMQGNQLLIKKDDGTVTAGLSGSTSGNKVRIWAGSTSPDSAPFQVTEDGKLVATNAEISGQITATSGKIGGFTIESGRLYWKMSDYFGGDSRSLKLGASKTASEGLVDVSFNGSTTGRFGVKVVGANLGGAAIYASRYSSGQSYPVSANTYAGYFDGGVHINGGAYCNVLLANEIGTNWSLGSDGKYSYTKGLTKDIEFVGMTMKFVNGLLVSI